MDAGVQAPLSARGAQTLADLGSVDGRVSSHCSLLDVREHILRAWILALYFI